MLLCIRGLRLMLSVLPDAECYLGLLSICLSHYAQDKQSQAPAAILYLFSSNELPKRWPRRYLGKHQYWALFFRQ